MMTAPPMAYYGGKTRLAHKIVALLPAHRHYVEPFAGSLAVLLAKPASRMETVNDLDGQLMTFWKVLRNQPTELMRACTLTPHSRAEYLNSRATDLDQLTDDVEVARLVWLKISQGRAAATRPAGTGWRYFIDPAGSPSHSMPDYLDSYVTRMATAAQRLRSVSLECLPAVDIIGRYGDFPDTCIYVDPPYLGSTRTDGGNGYRVDMRSADEHAELLALLLSVRAAVVISGYASTLYDTALAGWDRLEIPAATTQGRRRSPRTEVLWSNRPICTPTLFDEPPP